ncbi:MAG: hypothetical protein L0G64_10345 [Acinetobacter sp.]|nr:hypothetical protein [Acinetobacter sp.]
MDRSNGSSYTNSTAGAGGTNTVTTDSSFEVQINQNGNDAVVNPNNRGEPQKGAAAINSSIRVIVAVLVPYWNWRYWLVLWRRWRFRWTIKS